MHPPDKFLENELFSYIWIKLEEIMIIRDCEALIEENFNNLNIMVSYVDIIGLCHA